MDHTDTTEGRDGGILMYSKLGFHIAKVGQKNDFNKILAVSVT